MAQVLFESVQVKPVSALGLSLPGWLPPVGGGLCKGPYILLQERDWERMIRIRWLARLSSLPALHCAVV